MTILRYVSPTGSNANSGLASGQAWATLAFAQQQIRDLIAANPTEEIVLILADDDRHAITAQLDFTALDSGTYPGSVTWRAASGTTPIISGGVVVDTWTLHDAGNNIWVADFEGDEFRQLYVNGTRCYRPQRIGGLSDGTYTSGGFTTTDEVTDYANIADVEMVYRQLWRESRIKVASAVSETSLTMQQPAQAFYVALVGTDAAVPYAIENAYEILEANAFQKTFYWDRTAGKIYLIPPTTIADPNDAEVIVPQLSKLATFEGASRINFDSIQFSHNTWLPGEGGYADIQSMVVQSRAVSDSQYMDNYGRLTPSAIEVRNSRSINFSGNIFTQLGSHGIAILDGCNKLNVTGSLATDISGHGIIVGRPDNLFMSNAPRQINIANNLIAYCGQEFTGSSGIFAPYATESTFEHNDFYKLPYSGIGFGWGWGNDKQKAITPTIKNRILNNSFRDVMIEMIDGAAIYGNGMQHAFLVDGNYAINSHNGECFYFDEGTFDAILTNNIADGVYDHWFKSHRTFGNFVVSGNSATVPTSTEFVPFAEGHPLIHFLDGATEWTPVDPAMYDPSAPTLAQANIVANAGRQAAYRTALPALTKPSPQFESYAIGDEIAWWLPSERSEGGSAVPDKIGSNDFTGDIDLVADTASGGRNALSFNGTDQIIKWDAYADGTSVSYSLWFYKSATAQSGLLISMGSAGGAMQLGIGDTTFDNDGHHLLASKDAAYWLGYLAEVTISTGWHHVSMELDGTGQMRVYLDAVQVFSDDVGLSAVPGGFASLAATVAETRFLSCLIDDVRYFSRELTAPERTRLSTRRGGAAS